VEILRFPDEVLNKFEEITKNVLAELSSKEELSKKIYYSYKNFQKNISKWSNFSK